MLPLPQCIDTSPDGTESLVSNNENEDYMIKVPRSLETFVEKKEEKTKPTLVMDNPTYGTTCMYMYLSLSLSLSLSSSLPLSLSPKPASLGLSSVLLLLLLLFFVYCLD